MAQFRSIRGKLTEQQKERHAEIRRQVEADMPRLRAEARQAKAEIDARIRAFRELKAERERQGLSLADIASRSDIDKSYLSKLENDAYPNPTLETLMRYAAALGGRIDLSFKPAA